MPYIIISSEENDLTGLFSKKCIILNIVAVLLFIAGLKNAGLKNDVPFIQISDCLWIDSVKTDSNGLKTVLIFDDYHSMIHLIHHPSDALAGVDGFTKLKEILAMRKQLNYYLAKPGSAILREDDNTVVIG